MKLIDWTKMPRGTMTNKGDLIRCIKNRASVLQALESGTPIILHTFPNSLRIVPATRWTYHDGGECPVPEGLLVKILLRDEAGDEVTLDMPISHLSSWKHQPPESEHRNRDTIAYRITGVDRAGGFTDDPSEVPV